MMLVNQELNTINRHFAADPDLRTDYGRLHNKEPAVTLIAVLGTVKGFIHQIASKVRISSAAVKSGYYEVIF
jgi:hypothetical protein